MALSPLALGFRMLLHRVNEAHFPEDPALQNVSARRGNVRNCSCNRESQTPPRRDGLRGVCSILGLFLPHLEIVCRVHPSQEL
jgi:hypothetical protein